VYVYVSFYDGARHWRTTFGAFLFCDFPRFVFTAGFGTSYTASHA